VEDLTTIINQIKEKRQAQAGITFNFGISYVGLSCKSKIARVKGGISKLITEALKKAVLKGYLIKKIK
jgi:hypothetical protein